MDHNPQAEQMADESMLRTLAAQALAIWPQEAALFDRYTLPSQPRILDVGCGSGEITARLARRYPSAELVGVDILEGPLAHARGRAGELGDRVRFEQGDAFALAHADASFDLVVCRHLSQAVPAPEKMLAELVRVCRPGGWVHVLSEDYGMLHFLRGELDPDRLWREGVDALARATGTDARIGRRTWALLNALGLRSLWVDYVTVDTLRVSRETFADIMRAWRDGYSGVLEQKGGLSPGEARLLFDRIIESIQSPQEYAVWHVPIVSGQKAPATPATPATGRGEP